MGNQPYYHSTRGEERCSPKEAILKGIASDGGLFVWELAALFQALVIAVVDICGQPLFHRLIVEDHRSVKTCDALHVCTSFMGFQKSATSQE